jgi:hypothetical protein
MDGRTYSLVVGNRPMSYTFEGEGYVAFWEVIPCSLWMATTVLEEVCAPILHV